jgi:N-acyl-D-amino-acid deacylase
LNRVKGHFLRKKIIFLFFIFIFIFPGLSSFGEEAVFYDLMLKGGLVVDGSGLPPYRADVAFKDGRVAAIGHLDESQAGQVIDATGQVVAPGFIDLLRHNDILWSREEQERAIREGITLALSGNCGFSVLDVQKNLEKLDRNPGLLNLATLIGQGSVRDWFVKSNRQKPATPAQMTLMKDFVAKALDQGAFGLSSGLGYEPGEWCQPDELEALGSVLTRYPHAVYYTHIRNYRSNVLSAIQEAIQLGKDDQIPVVIQHLLFKLPSNWDQTESGLRLLEDARAQGQSVYASVYPYDFWGNEVQIPLAQFLYLPAENCRWSYYNSLDRVSGVLSLIHRRLMEYGGGDKVEITRTGHKKEADWIGLTIKDLSKLRGLTEDETVLALILENGKDLKICYHGLSEAGLIKKIQAPYILFGSDSTGNIPHPRDVGAFPRLIGTYVRDKRVVRLSEIIERLTREPALLMGLKDRGWLKDGYWGDAVVFDFNTIADKASASAPWERPVGVNTVVVNGQVVMQNGEMTGKIPGKVLRRSNQ